MVGSQMCSMSIVETHVRGSVYSCEINREDHVGQAAQAAVVALSFLEKPHEHVVL